MRYQYLLIGRRRSVQIGSDVIQLTSGRWDYGNVRRTEMVPIDAEAYLTDNAALTLRYALLDRVNP